MDTHGLGKMNENGEIFADLYAFNKFIIRRSALPHRRIHKATENLIKHFKNYIKKLITVKIIVCVCVCVKSSEEKSTCQMFLF